MKFLHLQSLERAKAWGLKKADDNIPWARDGLGGLQAKLGLILNWYGATLPNEGAAGQGSSRRGANGC